MNNAAKQLRNYASLWLIIILVAVAVRTLTLGSAKEVSLDPAEPLSGAISQSFVASGTNKAIPVAGKDYQIDSTKYLDNGSWAAVWVVSGSQNSSRAVVILHKVNGGYRVVLGPGTAFSISSSEGLPDTVLNYLRSKGVLIYTPAGGQ